MEDQHAHRSDHAPTHGYPSSALLEALQRLVAAENVEITSHTGTVITATIRSRHRSSTGVGTTSARSAL
jgi:hypothetical protein